MRLILQLCLCILVLLGARTSCWGRMVCHEPAAASQAFMWVVVTDPDAPPIGDVSGGWISHDATGFVDGPNLYAYVKQNPWTCFDPDGLLTEKQRGSLRKQNKDAETIIKHFDKDAKPWTPEAVKKADLQKDWFGYSTSPQGSRIRSQNPGESDDDMALVESARRNTKRAQVLLAEHGYLDKNEVTKLQLRGMGTLAESTLDIGLTLLPYSSAIRAMKPLQVFVTKAAGNATKQPMTTLYRAVGPDELVDIKNTGQFINRGSAEGKYFTSSSAHASDYAKQAVSGFGDPPYTTVRTQVPRSSLPRPTSVDGGIPAYVIPDRVLPGMRPTVMDTMAVPPLK